MTARTANEQAADIFIHAALARPTNLLLGGNGNPAAGVGALTAAPAVGPLTRRMSPRPAPVAAAPCPPVAATGPRGVAS